MDAEPSVQRDVVYAPLGNSQIRLFRLARLQDGSISGEMRSFTLDGNQCPEYMTTSYVWGPQRYSKAILLNSLRIPVLHSLYPLLETICDHKDFSQSRWWWIDSICINQEDDKERSSQVELMGRIYKKAKLTIVWLGEETDQSVEATEFLRTLSDPKWKSGNDRTVIKPLLDHKLAPKWKAVEALLSNEWWKRVWTLQEFIISEQVKFYWGPANVSRAQLMAALLVNWSCFQMDRKLVHWKTFEPAWSRRRLNQWYRNVNETPLLAMMAHTGDYHATDPRDKVYSLLGIANPEDCELIGKPDYNATVADVYSRFVKSFVERRHNLDIICFAHIFNRHKRDSSIQGDIPSWVPDWRAIYKPCVVPLMASQSGRSHVGNFRPLGKLDGSTSVIYEASGRSMSKASFSDDLKELICEGVLLDYVDGIASLGDFVEACTNPHENRELSHACVQSTSSTNKAELASEDASNDNSTNEDKCFDIFKAIAHSLLLDSRDRYFRRTVNKKRIYSEFLTFANALLNDSEKVDPVFLKWFNQNRTLSIKGQTLDTIFEAVISRIPSLMSRLQQTSSRRSDSSEPELSMLRNLDLKDSSDWESFLGLFRYMSMQLARRMIVTNDGYIGMAPCGAKKGDVIAVIYGCSIPVLLRELPKKDTYELIGECYVHGFMRAEAIKDVSSGIRTAKMIHLL